MTTPTLAPVWALKLPRAEGRPAYVGRGDVELTLRTPRLWVSRAAAENYNERHFDGSYEVVGFELERLDGERAR